MAYQCHRTDDVTASPETAWAWLEERRTLVPETADDEVTWSYDPIDPWHVAFTPGIRPLGVVVDGEVVLDENGPTRVDAEEARARAVERARRLHARL